MFLMRSIFWLTVAYLVIKPGVDFPDAGAMTASAMAAGTQIVAERIETFPCETLQCFGGKAVLSATLQSSTAASQPMPAMPTTNAVPVPRPRPDRAG